jgi:hypothetical protein
VEVERNDTATTWRPGVKQQYAGRSGSTCIVCVVRSEVGLGLCPDNHGLKRNELYRLMTHGSGWYYARSIEARRVHVVHGTEGGVRHGRLEALTTRRRRGVLVVGSHVASRWLSGLATEEGCRMWSGRGGKRSRKLRRKGREAAVDVRV